MGCGSSSQTYDGTLRIVDWNVAAVNNNPFEYWMTHSDPGYVQLMDFFQQVVSPTPVDGKTPEIDAKYEIPLSNLLTEERLTRLIDLMKHIDGPGTHWEESKIDAAKAIWLRDYASRPLITGFLKDKVIGSKRLLSMPDRVTNTISLEPVVCRPSVINCSDGDFSSLEAWWPRWCDFMFTMRNPHYSLIKPILKSKYEAISEEEEKVSVPLQVICLAAFDAVLLHIMLQAPVGSSGRSWDELKQDICDQVVKKKTRRTVAILETKKCATGDVIFLQEASPVLCHEINQKQRLNHFHAVLPTDQDVKKQLCVVLVSKNSFKIDTIRNVSGEVMDTMAEIDQKVVTAKDLLVIAVDDLNDVPHLLVSFHCDSTGLNSQPVIEGLHQFYEQYLLTTPQCRLVVGCDANTHQDKEDAKKKLRISDFLAKLSSIGMTTNFGSRKEEMVDANGEDLITVYNARTFVQPQLHKGVRNDLIEQKGNIALKDYVLFVPSQYRVVAAREGAVNPASAIDNMGQEQVEFRKQCLPTLDFPSDHAMVLTHLEPVPNTD